MSNNADRPKLQLPITPELDQMYVRASEKVDMGKNERYLRSLLGDEVYEMWDND